MRVLCSNQLTVRFDGLCALDGIDFSLHEGELLGLIGPNGAGKTTLLNTLTGFQDATSGSVRLDSEDITRLSPMERARRGIARTFQTTHTFWEMTVLENLEVAAVGTGQSRAAATRRARELLRVIGLGEREDSLAKHLAYGDGRKLAVGRALACDPRFLLLDEPAAGLNEDETDDLSELILRVRTASGMAVLLVEHDMRLVMNLCERLHVLDYGKTLCVGSPAEVRANELVINAYLGTGSVSHD